jgi:hypothetical protein
MQEEYITQGTNTYLVFKLSDSDKIDELALKMMTNNAIRGFAAVTFSQHDNEHVLWYNVSAKVSLKEFFSGTVSKSSLLAVF